MQMVSENGAVINNKKDIQNKCLRVLLKPWWTGQIHRKQWTDE